MKSENLAIGMSIVIEQTLRIWNDDQMVNQKLY